MLDTNKLKKLKSVKARIVNVSNLFSQSHPSIRYVVAGGSFYSIFNAQPVNDYDIFIWQDRIGYHRDLLHFFDSSDYYKVTESSEKFDESSGRDWPPGWSNIVLVQGFSAKIKYINEDRSKILFNLVSPSAMYNRSEVDTITGENLIKTFDYTHCSIFYSPQENTFGGFISALQAVVSKELVFNRAYLRYLLNHVDEIVDEEKEHKYFVESNSRIIKRYHAMRQKGLTPSDGTFHIMDSLFEIKKGHASSVTNFTNRIKEELQKRGDICV